MPTAGTGGHAAGIRLAHSPGCGAQHRPCVPYHGGKVLATTRSYLIFWLPPGRHFEPHGSDARYERLIVQFFRDVGGTPFYNLLTQYSRTPAGKPVKNGPIRNVSIFGGSYVDRAPYPATGTIYDPLLDVDFTHQLYAVAAREKWPLYEPSIFFIFIGAGVRECGTAPCKYSPDSCAMHWGLEYGVTWAAVNDPSLPDCAPVRRRTPNKDALADMAINFASHELFEAVTDPVPCEGWVRKCGEDVLPREIGDLCVHDFAPLNRDGSDVVLHDHTYLLQEEWSNRAGRCVLPSSAYPPPRPASPISWGGIPPGIVLGTVLALLLTALAAFLVRSMQRRPGSESSLSQPDSP